MNDSNLHNNYPRTRKRARFINNLSNSSSSSSSSKSKEDSDIVIHSTNKLNVFLDFANSVFTACKNGDVQSLDTLLSKIVSNPNKKKVLEHRDSDGFTPLMIATRQGHIEICRKLILTGVDINLSNEKGNSSLVFASQKGCLEIARLLLAAGASLDSANASIIPAAHFGHNNLVMLLLQYGANPNYVNAKGTTALMRASQEGRSMVVRTLLKAGAVCNASNAEGMTALMLSAQRGHHDITSTLIKSGAEVNMHTRQGSTALVLSAKRGHVAVVKVLVAAGADIFKRDERQKTAYDTASRRGYVHILDILTVESQLRLMRQARRNERSFVIIQMATLYAQNRASIKTNQKRNELNNILTKVLSLPTSLVIIIATMIPFPRLWKTQIQCLVTRCSSEPNIVVRDGLQVIDEILLETFSGLEKLPMHCRNNPMIVNLPNSNIISYLSTRPDFCDQFLKSGPFEMDRKLLSELCRLGYVQGSIMSYGITNIIFKQFVGNEIISVARNILEWYNQIHNIK